MSKDDGQGATTYPWGTAEDWREARIAAVKKELDFIERRKSALERELAFCGGPDENNEKGE